MDRTEFKKVVRRAQTETKSLNIFSDDNVRAIARRPLTVQECAEMHRCKKHPPRRATLLFVDGKRTLVGDPYKH